MENSQQPLANDMESGQDPEKIKRYLNSILQFRWVILSLSLLVFALSALHISRAPNIYTASSSVLIENVQTTVLKQEEVKATNQRQTFDYLQTQVLVVKSFPVSLEAAQQLNLKDYFGTSSNDQAAARLRGMISAKFVPRTRIVKITITYTDPQMAAKFANAIAKAYIAVTNRERFSVSKQMLEMFPDDIEALESGDQEYLIDKMKDPYFVDSLPSVMQDQTVQNLKSEKIRLESDLSDLKTRYTDEHPKVKTVVEKISHLEKKITRRTNVIIAGVKRSLAGEFNVSNVKIFEKAKAPRAPSGPNRKRFILTNTLLALAFGIFGSIALGTLFQTVNSEEDIAQITNAPYLGYVPLVQKQNLPIHELLKNRIIFDALTMLHTSLMFAMPRDRNKLIMITSCVPNEGKSAFSSMMAYTMARIGSDKTKATLGMEDKILLVECDIRRPSFAAGLNLDESKQKGLADFLIGKAEFDDILTPVNEYPNLTIITAGRESPNPQALFTSSAFDDFVHMVEQKYTRIIFDAPPFLSIPEASIISKKVHGTVFVVSAGMLQRKILLKSMKKFNLLNSTVFGIVLNRLNIQREKHYHGYDYKAVNKDSAADSSKSSEKK